MPLRPDHTIELSELGSALVTGAAVILAIRTARREAVTLDAHCANQDLQREVEYAVQLSARIIAVATSRHAEFFEQKVEEFTTGIVEEDVRL